MSNGSLTPEFASEQLFVSEMSPERPFGVGGVFSEMFGSLGGGLGVQLWSLLYIVALGGDGTRANARGALTLAFSHEGLTGVGLRLNPATP